MLNKNEVRQALLALVVPHLGRNIRNFNYRILDNSVGDNAFGIAIDPKPFEGKIVEYTEQFMLIKTGRKEFAVVDLTYVTDKPAIGSKVMVTPYARRHFNGKRIDEPKVEHETLPTGTVITKTHLLLGGETTKLPVPEVKCPELAEMINQLQELTAPDGLRKLAHVLVDAKATDFSVVDPLPSQIINTPPTVSFKVATQKFKGNVAIQYDRIMDAYTIQLKQLNQLARRIDNIYFDELGQHLVDLIDDGNWQKIEIVIVSNAKKSKVA